MPQPPRPEWLDPLEYPPPRGNKIRLLTYGNIDTTGHWRDEDCVAWLPLANTPSSIKHRQLLWATGRHEELRKLLQHEVENV